MIFNLYSINLLIDYSIIKNKINFFILLICYIYIIKNNIYYFFKYVVSYFFRFDLIFISFNLTNNLDLKYKQIYLT